MQHVMPCCRSSLIVPVLLLLISCFFFIITSGDVDPHDNIMEIWVNDRKGINIQPNFRAATDPDELPSKRWHAKHPPREKEDVVVIPEWQAPDTAPSLPVQPVAAQPIVSSSYSQPAVSSNGAATTTTTAGPTATTSNSNQVTTTSPPPISGSSGGAVSSTYLFVSNGTTLTATNVQYPRGANGTNVTVPITFTVRNGTITNPEITGVLFTGCSGEMSAFSWSPVAWVYTLLLPLVLFAM